MGHSDEPLRANSPEGDSARLDSDGEHPFRLAIVDIRSEDATGDAERRTLTWEAQSLGWEIEHHAVAEEATAHGKAGVSDADAIVLSGAEGSDEDRGDDAADLRDQDAAAVELVRRAALAATPLLGIGRGHRIVNLAFGGTVTETVTPAGNALPADPSAAERVVLRVSMARSSALAFRLGESLTVVVERGPVVETVGQGLRPAAWTPEGHVAALEHEVLPITSVHWLPAAERSEAGQTLLLLDGLAREAERSAGP